MTLGRATPSKDWRHDIAGALIDRAVHLPTLDIFVSSAGRLLANTPLDVDRVFLSLQMLHAAFRARTYLWRRQTDRVRTIGWPHGLRNRPGYDDSPDFHVHLTGKEFHIPSLEHFSSAHCSLYGDLRANGYVSYLMLPLHFGDGSINTFAIAGKAPTGFADDDLDQLRQLNGLLSVIVERYAALETVASTLDTYLGRSAAREVLGGRIRVGEGDVIDAVVLFADLNDFTRHAAALEPTGTVQLINSYFDCLVGEIEEHGGYVLKFIGDAVLAFFPVLPNAALPSPVSAVRASRKRLDRLNQSRRAAGEEPLGQKLCVHFGPVLYGNIGSTERLDFTIIGETVNVAARGAETAKKLGVDCLFTAAFVDRFGDDGLALIGRQRLRSVADPMNVFALGPVR